MKKIKKYKKYIIVVLSIFLIYSLWPKCKPLDKLFFKNCNKENITLINIRSTAFDLDKSIKDKNKINEIVSNLAKAKLTEYHGFRSNIPKDIYDISIWEDSNVTATIYIRGRQYIIDYVDDFNKIYKINDNSLDIKYFDELLLE